MDDASGADLPKRRLAIFADMARGHRGFVELRIATAHACHLQGCQLQLLLKDHPRPGQKPVAQAPVQFGGIGENGHIAALIDADRAFDLQGARAFFKDDPLRL